MRGEKRSQGAGGPLRAQTVQYLASLPRTLRRVVAGVRVPVWHARPGDDMAGIYPASPYEELREVLCGARADVLVVGHTHVPMHVATPEGVVVNSGALLRDAAPSWDDPLPATATFGVLELPSGRFTIHRLEDGAEVG